MEAKDVRKMLWTKVKDWSGLFETCYVDGTSFICSRDVDEFLENIHRDIAQKLNIHYEKLKPILVAENTSFHCLKEEIFEEYTEVSRDSDLFLTLKDMLRMPDISKVENVTTDDKVSKCLKMFERLSNEEKMLFLEKIEKN